MATSKAVFRVSVRGAGRRAREFDRAARRTQDAINAELRELGRELERAYAAAAPVDSSRTRESVRAVLFFRAARPRVSIHAGAVDPDSGYPYLDVTRRGHRVARIYAKPGSVLKVHSKPRTAGVYKLAQSVRGARPAEDWVAVASTRARPLFDRAERRLGRRLDTRLLR